MGEKYPKYIYESIGWAIFLAAIMINSSYAYMTEDNFATIPTLLALMIILGLKYLSVSSNLTRISIFSFFIILFCLSSIIEMIILDESQWWGSYFRQIFILVIALLITRVIDFNAFIKHFIIFLRIVCIASLFMFFLVNIAGYTNFPTFVNSNGIVYYSIYIAFVMVHEPLRCMGPFWEPGIFASFLCLGIFFELCIIKSKKNIRDIILFYVLILLTFSTSGYIIGVIISLLGIGDGIKNITRCILFAFLALAYIVTLLFNIDVAFILSSLMPGVFGKITSNSVSMMTRLNGPLIDFEIWRDNFILGSGIHHYQVLWDIVSKKYLVGSRTSTLTYFLAVFGLPGFFYVFSVIRGCMKQISESISVRLMFLTVWIFILSKEPHNYNLLSMIFIFYLNSLCIGLALKSSNK